MNARYQAFDTAEHLALSADTAWEAVKDRGNAALKEGDYLGASRLYRDAGQLALGPLKGGMIHAFMQTLESFPDGSAQRRLAETSDILWDNLIDTLPTPPLDRKIEIPRNDGGEVMSAEHPNKGAGIAFANRAQALLAAGKPKTALKSARRATAANPSYVKAHYREMKALEALGLEEEAAEIREEIENFGKLRAMRMQEALALVAVGWIDWHRWASSPSTRAPPPNPNPNPNPSPNPNPNPSPNPNQRDGLDVATLLAKVLP